VDPQRTLEVSMDAILIRAEEAGKLLGLGRSKIYEMLASGELPVVRVGRSVRVPVEALREWVSRQTRPSNEKGR
jgi:excisionase family DNA binding protein